MTNFPGALTAWAHVATYLEVTGTPPLDARLTFLNALSDYTMLMYANRLPLDGLEEPELRPEHIFTEVDRHLTNDAAALDAKFALFHELGHVHLNHFENGQASRAKPTDTAEVSTFHEHNIEPDADALANEYLIDKDGSLAAALASKVAAPIYFYLLPKKEALPAYVGHFTGCRTGSCNGGAFNERLSHYSTENTTSQAADAPKQILAQSTPQHFATNGANACTQGATMKANISAVTPTETAHAKP